jgi:hypothetical protein
LGIQRLMPLRLLRGKTVYATIAPPMRSKLSWFICSYDAFKGCSDHEFLKIDEALLELGVDHRDVWSIVAGASLLLKC